MEPLAAFVIVLAVIAYLVSRFIVFRNAMRRDREKEQKDGHDSLDMSRR
jgi:hypothetical protein